MKPDISENRRICALGLAIQHYEPYRGKVFEAADVIDTAKAFEAYLKGNGEGPTIEVEAYPGKVIPVGEGWRVLGNDEEISEGDCWLSLADPATPWKPVESTLVGWKAYNAGSTVRTRI